MRPKPKQNTPNQNKQTKSCSKKNSTLSSRHPSTGLVDLSVAEFILYKLQFEKGCVISAEPSAFTYREKS